MELVTYTSRDLLQIVSRSFALCIPSLENNKIKEVENMYLLSRVVDTIEDSTLSVERKKTLMKDFFITLHNEENLDEFLHGLREGTVDEHDKILSVKANYKLILDTFHSLDESVQETSISLLKEMSSGMLKYLENEIKDFEDLDDYCYYVAGTVGLYLTELIKIKDGIQLNRKQTVNLGRYLQKVNVIKNFHKDQQEGRNFWPTSLFNGYDRKAICDGKNKKEALLILEKMVKNAMKDSIGAFEYIASIDYSLSGYRKFTLLCTLMATENLRLIHNNPEIFINPKGVKIPRERMLEIFDMVEEASHSNEILRKYQQRLKPVF